MAFDPDIVKGLYRRGLIYFDVPVYPDDRFKGELPFLLCIFVYPFVKGIGYVSGLYMSSIW